MQIFFEPQSLFNVGLDQTCAISRRQSKFVHVQRAMTRIDLVRALSMLDRGAQAEANDLTDGAHVVAKAWSQAQTRKAQVPLRTCGAIALSGRASRSGRGPCRAPGPHMSMAAALVNTPASDFFG
jgi:hypothetical protein